MDTASNTKPIVYCVGCREKYAIYDEQIVTRTWKSPIEKVNVNRKQLIGKCVKCGRNVGNFVSNNYTLNKK